MDNGQERYAFDRFIAVGRDAGFIPEKVTVLIDGTPVKGAGAVQDIYTLLRKAIRKLLKAAGYHLPSKRQGLSVQARKVIEVVKVQSPPPRVVQLSPVSKAREDSVVQVQYASHSSGLCKSLLKCAYYRAATGRFICPSYRFWGLDKL